MVTVTIRARMLACWMILALGLLSLAGCASSSQDRDTGSSGGGCCGR